MRLTRLIATCALLACGLLATTTTGADVGPAPGSTAGTTTRVTVGAAARPPAGAGGGAAAQAGRALPDRDALVRDWGLPARCNEDFARIAMPGDAGIAVARLRNGVRLLLVRCGLGASLAQTAVLASSGSPPRRHVLVLPGLEDWRVDGLPIYASSSIAVDAPRNALLVMHRRAGPGPVCGERLRFRIRVDGSVVPLGREPVACGPGGAR